jgi:hypothetical protein
MADHVVVEHHKRITLDQVSAQRTDRRRPLGGFKTDHPDGLGGDLGRGGTGGKIDEPRAVEPAGELTASHLLAMLVLPTPPGQSRSEAGTCARLVDTFEIPRAPMSEVRARVVPVRRPVEVGQAAIAELEADLATFNVSANFLALSCDTVATSEGSSPASCAVITADVRPGTSARSRVARPPAPAGGEVPISGLVDNSVTKRTRTN